MTNPDSAASAASALLPHNQPHSKTGLQAQLDAQPISPLQWRVIILCWLVNMLDGFDLLAISFAAPAIAKAWQLAPQTLGVVFSSGLLGMMAGSLIFGPAADHVGRRRMIIFACLVLAISMLATAHANSVGQLMLLRGITGMAIGALLPSLNTLVAEYTPDRRKNLAISFMHVGYPIGGIAGGWLASQLIPTHGWPALFWLGGLFTLAIVPIIFFGLPESLHYLLQKNQPAAKAKAVKIARRMGLAIQSDILNTSANKTNLDQASRQTLRTILHRPWLAPSLALWACFFLSNLTLYFLLNWTPSILTTAGLPASQAMRAGMLLNFGGVIGMLSIGYLSARWSLYYLMSGYFILGGLFIIALGQLPTSEYLLLGFTLLSGLFSLGGLIGLYSLTARLYPTTTRATGVGLAIGAGRFGAILGPYAGGLLISLGWPMSNYFALLTLPLIAVAGVLWWVKQPTMSRHNN